MATVEEYCQTCRRMTIWNVTKVTPGRTNRKEDIVTVRCTTCGWVCLRKVDQKENEEDA